MKIEESKVKKLTVTEISGLDPISIFLEYFEKGKGKITITCYDKSWHSYWGAMGDRTITEFFLSCDEHYIAKNLSSIESSVEDYEKLSKEIKAYYKDRYEDDEYEIVDLYNDIDGLSDEKSAWDSWLYSNNGIMTEVFGDDWYMFIPTRTNPQYKYLCRIINTTKDALRSKKCTGSLTLVMKRKVKKILEKYLP